MHACKKLAMDTRCRLFFFIAHYSSLFPPFPSSWLSLGYLIFTHCFRLLFTFSLRHVMYTSRIPWALFLILPFTLPCLLSFNISVFTCLLPRTPSFLPHLDFQCHLIWNWLFFWSIFLLSQSSIPFFILWLSTSFFLALLSLSHYIFFTRLLL